MRSLPFLFALLAIVSASSAQAERPIRQWITGKVQRSDGSPWANGTVTLHSHSWRIAPDPTLGDRVTVTANGHGMFRAAVQPGRSYVVWCQSKVVEDRFTTTNMVTASAGTPIVLRESPHARCTVELAITGIEAYKDRGPLRAEAIAFVDARLQAPCADLGNGRFAVPPMPVSTAYVRITDRAGAVLTSTRVPLRVAARERLATVTEHTVDLPPPVPIDIRVESLAGPVSGAELTWCDRTDHRLWATTDKTGLARLVVPRVWGDKGEGALRYLSFWVRGQGVVTAHAYTFDHRVPRDGSPGQWQLSLPAGYHLKGRLLWRDGRPAKRVPLQLHTGAPGGKSFVGQGATMGGSPLCAWTDDEGRFSIPGRPGFLGYQLSTFLRDGNLAELPRSGIPYSPFVVLASGVEAAGQDTELGDIVLADYVPIDVTALDTDGQPAAGHAIHFREELNADMQEKRVCYTRVDWQGRIRLLGRPGETLAISVMMSGDSDDIGPPELVTITAGQPATVALRTASR